MATEVTATPLSESSPQVTPERIMQLAWGYAPTLIIETALRLGLFDALDQGAKTEADLRSASGASERGLTMLLNVMAGLQLIANDGQGNFSLTPESSAFLVSSRPGYLGGFIRHTSEDLLPKWMHLQDVVVTGGPTEAVNQHQAGAEFFEHFVNDIFPLSFPPAKDLADHLQLGQREGKAHVLDLAAGSGVWGIVLAQSGPQVHVCAVDWPEVLRVTRKNAEKFGFADRFSFREGDLHDTDFGTGYQVATLGHILHSEGEELSKKLLAKTFKALASGGVIAIQEFLVNEDRSGPVAGLIFGVNMLVNTDNGGVFSFEEIASWLKDAGFVEVRTLASRGPSPLILANKP